MPETPPAPNTPPADGTPAPLVKVTIDGGVQIELPKAQAEQVLAARTKSNAEREALAQAAGAAKAERDAATARAAQEAAEKEAMRLAAAGEHAKAREIYTAEANAKLARVATRQRDQALEIAFRAANPALDAMDIELIIGGVRSCAVYNTDTGSVDLVDGAGAPLMAEGKPLGLDRFAAEWLQARPRFQPARVPTPGNAGPAPGPAPAGTIRVADLPNLTTQQAADMKAGKLKVIA